jgi:enoyl-CoA hydratase/carnithine racemase
MSAARFPDLILDVEDPVALITLNRPSTLNSFTHETLVQLRRAVDVAANDPAVAGIVITGAGGLLLGPGQRGAHDIGGPGIRGSHRSS